MNTSLYKYFATTYDCGAYGGDEYSSASTCESLAPSTTIDNGPLSNTGVNAWIGLAIGLVLVGAAIVILLKNKTKKR